MTDDTIVELQEEIRERGTPLDDNESLFLIAEHLGEIVHQLTVSNEHHERLVELLDSVINERNHELQVRCHNL